MPPPPDRSRPSVREENCNAKEIKDINLRISDLAARRKHLKTLINAEPTNKNISAKSNIRGKPIITKNVLTRKARPSLTSYESDAGSASLARRPSGTIAVESRDHVEREAPEPPPPVSFTPATKAFRSTMRRRPPKNAAVLITSKDPNTIKYEDILKKARGCGALEELDIAEPRLRRGLNGGYVLEIPGPEGASLADKLAKKLREVIGTDARVTRPVAMGEIRVWNFDESVSTTEITNVVSVTGDCCQEDIKVGSIRKQYNGLGSIWVKCPLAAAIRIATPGRLRIGWSSARVELLEARPVQCYKCWRYGHVRNTCSFPEDRTGACFKCGATDHTLRDCAATPRCVICSDADRPDNHRLGSLRICNERSIREPVRRTEVTRPTNG